MAGFFYVMERRLDEGFQLKSRREKSMNREKWVVSLVNRVCDAGCWGRCLMMV